MVLYGINLFLLPEEIWAVDPGLLYPFYADDTEFESSLRKRAHLLKLIAERVPDEGYFPEPTKSIFISDSLGQKNAAKS